MDQKEYPYPDCPNMCTINQVDVRDRLPTHLKEQFEIREGHIVSPPCVCRNGNRVYSKRADRPISP